MTVKTRQFLL